MSTAVIVCAGIAGLTTIAGARPTAGGLDALRPVPGSGTLHFTDTDTSFGGLYTGTVTTKATPAVIKPGEPVKLVVDMKWTLTDQRSPCPYTPGVDPGQTTKPTSYPLATIRPGHGEDLSASRVIDASGAGTMRMNGNSTACGPPNTLKRAEGWDAVIPGSSTAGWAPGCYAPFPQILNSLNLTATYDGTFATVSVGGVDCATGASAAGTAFTDTFSTAGQAKPHAVAVPARKTKAEITLRWAKPGDRFTVAGVVLVPKRKTSSVGRAEKLKITFFSRTGTSLGIRITNVSQGKLSFRIVSTKVSGRTTVRTRVVLKA